MLAHAVPGHAWAHWLGEPAAAAAVVAAGAGYALGERRRRRAGGPPAPGEVGAFASGWTVLALALAGPLEAMAGALLSAHMIQHTLLTAVAAPLLLLGRPGRRLARVVPAATGGPARLWWRTRRRVSVPHGPAGPAAGAVTALVAHALGIWTWHLPGLYEAALRSLLLHGLEHATLFGTALWFWAEVFRLARRAHPQALLVLFAAGAQGAALGVLLTFASRAAYPVHAPGAAAWGLTPLEDQQIGAVAMWMGGGMVYVAAAVAVAAAWLAAADGRSGRPTAGRRAAAGTAR